MNDTITEESIKEMIKDYIKSVESKDVYVVMYYCKGIGASVRTNSYSSITCDHPECSWCRGIEKAFKDEFGVTYQKQPEMEIDKKPIPNGFRKFKKGSKFTKKKKRNR